MAAHSRGSRAVSSLLTSPSSICTRCARTQFAPLVLRRSYSVAVSGAIDTASIVPPESVLPNVLGPQPQTSSAYHIKSGIILTRAPLITRDLTPFEAAFFFYQKRLSERLSASFRKAFFYRLDTPAELDWRNKVRERHGVPTKDIGRYNPRGPLAWNDELLVNSPTSDTNRLREVLAQDAQMRISEDGEVIPPEDRMPVELPLPRRTEADEKKDVRRLDRALDRTLYLVVRSAEGTWSFPTAHVRTEEALHETAARVLEESAGVNMNTWMVGRVPVAHHVSEPVLMEDGVTVKRKGDKMFFLKGRIMAGQANIEGNPHGLTDFKWLTREELANHLPSGFFWNVRGMMADR